LLVSERKKMRVLKKLTPEAKCKLVGVYALFPI